MFATVCRLVYPRAHIDFRMVLFKLKEDGYRALKQSVVVQQIESGCREGQD
jgi:hypothetical protein